MKFQSEHYQSLKTAISTFLQSENMNVEQVKAKYVDRGLSFTRCLWDVYHHSKWALNNREANDMYYDSHIETAIKKVFSELN